MEITRKEFIKSLVAAVVSTGVPATSRASSPGPSANIRLGATLYSYGPDIASRAMTLEDCIADVADMGGQGIEILGESHVPNYPNPPDQWVAQWHAWMDKYKVVPSAYDTFVDSMFYRDRVLTSDEAAARLAVDFKLASRLGYKVLRQQWPPYPADNPGDTVDAPYVKARLATETILKALPMAEKHDVKMCIELHSPAHLKSAFIESIVETVDRTGTKHLGFCPDFSIFVRKPQRHQISQFIAQGARPEIIDFIVKAYEQQLGPERTVAEVRSMGGNDAELHYAGIAGVYHSSNNDPKDLAPIIPYCHHVHAKFYEMTEELREYSIPYDEILPVFVERGYNGFLSSEYEGSREKYTTSAAIRAQHAMCRSILGMTS